MITVTSREEYLKQLALLLPAHSTGVEIGVLNGDFSEMILNIINPKHLILIDPYTTNNSHYGGDPTALTSAYSTEEEFQAISKRFEEEIKIGTIGILRRFSYDAVGLFADSSVDFIYIDASHIYDDVKKDLNQGVKNLKPDGIMCLHDYVAIACFGVIQAVDEFTTDKGFEMVIYNSNGGDVALKKSSLL